MKRWIRSIKFRLGTGFLVLDAILFLLLILFHLFFPNDYFPYFSILIFILLVITNYILFRLIVSRRFRSLQNVIKQVQSGDLSARINDLIPGDELGSLEQGINAMVENLAKNSSTINQQADDLSQVEFDLHDREERLQAVLQGSNIGLWDINLNTNRLYLNDYAAELMGYPIPELSHPSQGWVTELRGTDKTAIQMKLKDLIIGSNSDFEMEFHKQIRSGEWRWYLSQGRVIQWNVDDSPARLVGTDRDITDYKASEKLYEALYQLGNLTSQEQSLDDFYLGIDQIINNLMYVEQLIIAQYDAETDQEVFLYSNGVLPEPVAKLGRSGLSSYTIRTGQPQLIRYADYSRLVEEGEIIPWGIPAQEWMGVPLRSADGKINGLLIIQTYQKNVHYTEKDKDLLTFISTHVALAIERRRAQIVLKVSQQRLQMAIESAHLGLLDTDLLTNKVYGNDQYWHILGYQPGTDTELDMKKIGRLVHPEDHQHVMSLYQAIATEKIDSFQAEYRLLTGNDEWKWVLDRGQIVEHDETGKPARLISTYMDITNRKQSERINEALSSLAAAMTSAEDLTTFCSSAHQIIARLLPADNLYIASYQPKTDRLSFVYYANEGRKLSGEKRLGNSGLTSYLFRLDKPILVTLEEHNRLVQTGEIEPSGPGALEWLGIPLHSITGQIIGALVVQIFDSPDHYVKSDLETLFTLSSYIARVIERRQAEEELRISEQRLEFAIESASLGLTDSNPILKELYGNDQFWQITGYSPEEVSAAGEDWFHSLAHPEDRPLLDTLSEKLIRNESDSFRIEYRVLTKDNQWKWILDNGHVVERDGNGTPRRIISTYLDITERKQSERINQALSDLAAAMTSTDSLPGFYQSAHKIIARLIPAKYMYIASYQAEADKLSFLYYNREESARISKIKLGNAGLTSYLFRMDKPLLIDQKEHDRLIKTGEIKSGGPTAVEWLGVPLHSVTGKIIGALVVQTFDPTEHYSNSDLEMLNIIAGYIGRVIERRQTEEELRISEQRLELAIESANLGIWDYNLITGEAYRNERWACILGYSLAEIGTDIGWMNDKIHPEDKSEQETKFMATFHNFEIPTYNAEYRVRKKDGDWVWIQDHGRIVEKNSEEQAARMVGTHLDITERKKAELLQTAIYKISEASSTTQDLQSLYRFVHQAIAEILSAENFYIALHQPDEKKIHFPYYIDLKDPFIPDDMPFPTPGEPDSLTSYLLQHGKPLLVDINRDKDWLNEARIIVEGELMNQWLGAPLKSADNLVFGVIVVQTYAGKTSYKESDIDLLAFLAHQVGMAIERVKASQALRESEQRFRSIFESAEESIILVDETGEVIEWNPSSSRITGVPAEEAIGSKVWDLQFQLLNPEKRSPVVYQRYESVFKDFFLTGQTNLFGKDIDVNIRHRDGKFIYIHQTAFTIPTPKGYMLGLMSQDTSERRQNEEQIRRQLERMAALRMIDISIASSFELETILEVLLEQITVQLKVDAADILRFNPATQTLDFAASRGFHTDAFRHTRLQLGESFAGMAGSQRRMIFVEDIRQQPGELERASQLSAENFFSYIGIPLVAKGELKGVLEILNRSPLQPDQEWSDFLEALAGQSAIAMDNASMFAELQHTNLELGMAYDTTLEGWAHALELRDMETEGHSRRVTDLTVELSALMGIKNDQLVHARRGALLHDIGKMGIPDHILFKPGALTPSEWTIMRRHPIYAYEMLAPIEFLQPALDIPYCHHEKWDGSGYPRGIKAEEIPLAARVFAVVDVWDSLIHDRPYKKAWSEEEATQYIASEAGKHFDPAIVKVFLKIIEKRRARS